MKKEKYKRPRKRKDEMRNEYDFTDGVRGKHYKAMEEG